MSYVPPLGTAANASWASSAPYTPPAGSAASVSWAAESEGGAQRAVVSWPLVVAARPAQLATLPWPIAVSEAAQASVGWPVNILSAAATGGLGGAGGWPAAPGGRWQAVVVLDGQDVSPRLIGQVRIEQAENAAATAEFSFVPSAPLQPLSLIGRSVRIAFAEQVNGATVNAQTMFSGVIETPSIDVGTGVITCACHDQLQERAAAMTRAQIDAAVGGRWHEAVSGTPADHYDYLEARIASVASGYALDALQQLRVFPWHGAGLKSATVSQADVIDGSVSIELPSRSELRTRIRVQMEYSFTRLHTRGVVAQYSQPVTFFLPRITPTVNFAGVLWLTTAMVQGATDGVSGWERVGETEITHPQPGSYLIGSVPEDGIYTITPAVAPDLATGFRAHYVTRWSQAVIERYSIEVVWGALEAQIGRPVAEEMGATLTAPFDQPSWDSDPTAGPYSLAPIMTPGAAPVLSGEDPIPVVGDIVRDWQPAGADPAARDEVLRTLLDRAWVRLYASSRSGRARFALPLRPDLWLDWWISLEADRLHTEGKVVAITHSLDMDSGAATTEVDIAVGMPGAGAASHPDWTLPPSPVSSYVPPVSALSFTIGTYVGGTADAVPFDAATMIGFSTNVAGPGADAWEYYPHQLSIKAPDIAEESRDPLELPAEAVIQTAIPTYPTEVL